MNTHGEIVDFGRHKGTLYTRMPISYLKWMINIEHSCVELAKAELERRGTTTPELEISGHALDRASQCCRDVWKLTRKLGGPGEHHEGIHSWLCRMAVEALEKGTKDPKGRLHYQEVIFVFEDQDLVWPVLKTVMRERRDIRPPLIANKT
jgi:hypothetical protein